MSRIGLQPSARPLDVFSAPEVRASSEGSSLLEVGAALAQFNSALRPYLYTRAEDLAHEARVRAGADVASRKIENQKQLREAVERGDLPESNNPWYMAGLERSVGLIEARRAGQSLQLDYENTPEVRFSDSPGTVEQWAKEKFAPLLEGRSTHELEAMLPELDNQVQSLVQSHLNVRSREREFEREAADTTTFRSEMAGFTSLDLATEDGAPNPDQYEALSQRLGAHLTDISKTVHPLKASKWFVQSVLDEAESRGDSEFAREILGRVNDPSTGGPLGSAGWVRNEMKSLEDRVEDHRFRELQRTSARDRLEEETQTKSLLGAAYSRYDEIRKQNPEATWADVSFTLDELSQASPAVRQNVEVMLNGFRNAARAEKVEGIADQRRALASQLLEGEMKGTITGATRVNMMVALTALGGDNDLSTVLSIVDRHKNNDWGDTSLETLSQLQEARRTGALTLEMVNRAAADKRLSHMDYRDWSDRAVNNTINKFGQDDSNRFVHSEILKLERSLVAGRSRLVEGFDPSQDPEFQSDLISAQVDADTAIRQWLDDHPNAPRAERVKAIDEIRDRIAEESGGIPYIEVTKDRIQRAKKLKAESEASPPAQPEPPRVSEVLDKAIQSEADLIRVTKERAAANNWSTEQAVQWMNSQRRLLAPSRAANLDSPSKMFGLGGPLMR